ncbi:MAG: SIS domain-containing protein [Bacteroides cellulosilyticus]
MADSIEAGRWVHTFGCGHATIPVEEMYPRIGSFVGFHPLCELPLTFFTQIIRTNGYPSIPVSGKNRGLRTGNHEEL